jgi:hypothetical protein
MIQVGLLGPGDVSAMTPGEVTLRHADAMVGAVQAVGLGRADLAVGALGGNAGVLLIEALVDLGAPGVGLGEVLSRSRLRPGGREDKACDCGEDSLGVHLITFALQRSRLIAVTQQVAFVF